jgi:hypothetical protein
MKTFKEYKGIPGKRLHNISKNHNNCLSLQALQIKLLRMADSRGSSVSTVIGYGLATGIIFPAQTEIFSSQTYPNYL